jgi:hypothetical protein
LFHLSLDLSAAGGCTCSSITDACDKREFGEVLRRAFTSAAAPGSTRA